MQKTKHKTNSVLSRTIWPEPKPAPATCGMKLVIYLQSQGRAAWLCVQSPGLGEEHRSSARSLLQPGLGSLSEQQQWELPGDGQSCSLCTSAPRPERSRASGLAGCIKNLHFRLGFIPHCSASNQSLCYHTTSAQEKPSRSLLLIKGRLLKGRLLCCAV